ncbi:DUF1648 domain-containing protein [Catenulispora subtropica]|uniref:DUF5808 domain-containing protein n=1 Tax=Catenulispora subtropica TaxID=450798 RepID=A0ABP5DAA0_9ACTN
MRSSSSLPVVVPIVLIGGLTLLTPLMTPRTVQFGVRIPAERAGDPAVAGARRGYRLGIVAVTVVAVLAAQFVATGTVARLSGVAIEVAGTFAVYLVARAHVAAAKHEGRWFEGLKQVAVADTALRTRPDRFPWEWGLPAAVIVVATVVFGTIRYPHMPDRLVTHYDFSGHPTSFTDKTFVSAFAPVGVQIAISALIVVLTRVTVRGKATLDVQDPQAAARHRRFVAVMARCLLLFAAAISLTLALAALTMWDVIGSTGWSLALLVAPVALATIGLVAVFVRVGQGGSRLHLDETEHAGAAAPSGTVNRDDDSLWKAGVFYFNRDDPAVWIQKRFGVGWTVNWARPAALAFLGGLAAVAILVPLLIK